MATKPLMRTLAQWHIWLGWLVGVPIVLWLASGLFMTLKPLPEVRGAQGSARSRRGTRIGRGARGLHAFFTKELWSRELASLPTFRRWGYGVARVVHLTLVNFIKDRCSWRASALTYITVLSLVPMLAFAFSVAKGMGAYESLLQQNIVPFLDATFGPADLDEAEDDEVATAEPDEASEEEPSSEEEAPSEVELPSVVEAASEE